MQKKVRTRFAPSPTGFMHVGNLRTALYEYLIAKSLGGDFVLRIEDTDQERKVEGAVDIIYNTMKAAGLKHDEGPDIGGEYGPYVQSERKDMYLPYAEKLIKKGLALPRCSLPMFEACEMKSELVPLGQAAGRIATDFVILYPPDAPLIVPGEEFSEDLICEILSYTERGFQIIGADDCSVLCAVSGMMN